MHREFVPRLLLVNVFEYCIAKTDMIKQKPLALKMNKCYIFESIAKNKCKNRPIWLSFCFSKEVISVSFYFVTVCVSVSYVCMYAYVHFARGFNSFGHKIFFSLAVSVSLRRLLLDVRAYCKHSALKL